MWLYFLAGNKTRKSFDIAIMKFFIIASTADPSVSQILYFRKYSVDIPPSFRPESIKIDGVMIISFKNLYVIKQSRIGYSIEVWKNNWTDEIRILKKFFILPNVFFVSSFFLNKSTEMAYIKHFWSSFLTFIIASFHLIFVGSSV